MENYCKTSELNLSQTKKKQSFIFVPEGAPLKLLDFYLGTQLCQRSRFRTYNNTYDTPGGSYRLFSSFFFFFYNIAFAFSRKRNPRQTTTVTPTDKETTGRTVY